jgi:hypothetical protein
MSTDVRTRAATVLGVAAEATADDAVAAFLTKLPATGFVPAGDSVAAVNVLAGLALPCDPDVESGIGVPEEIDEFIRSFWSLAPADRLAKWRELGSRSNDSIAERLLVLQAGLEVPTTPRGEPQEEEVATLARELFLLAPRARAIRRNEWLLANAARHAELVRATSELQRHIPATINLEPELFARLTREFAVTQFAASAVAKPLPASQLILAEPSQIESAERITNTARHTHVPSSSQGGKWPIPAWPIVAGVLIFFRVLLSLGTSTTSSTRVPNNVQAPPVSSFYRATSGMGFSREEVDRFKRYEARHGGTTPLRYDEWERAGKPEANRNVPKFVPSQDQPYPASRLVTFSEDDIRRFEEYEEQPIGPEPPLYDKWVKARRPREAGLAVLPPDEPDRPAPKP